MTRNSSVNASLPARITKVDLAKALAKAWTRQTSYDPARWSADNPAWGQCAISALVAQDVLGGSLLVGEFNGIQHYWNLLPNNRQLDLTKHQFGRVRSFQGPRRVERGYVLSFPDTQKRYEVLRRVVLAELESCPSSRSGPRNGFFALPRTP